MAQPLWLRIEGARQNNLKNVSLAIPHDRVTVITGVSGSGKSSLAFDTIFAEGQWRYIESLSAYARMFLDRVDDARAAVWSSLMGCHNLGSRYGRACDCGAARQLHPGAKGGASRPHGGAAVRIGNERR